MFMVLGLCNFKYTSHIMSAVLCTCCVVERGRANVQCFVEILCSWWSKMLPPFYYAHFNKARSSRSCSAGMSMLHHWLCGDDIYANIVSHNKLF